MLDVRAGQADMHTEPRRSDDGPLPAPRGQTHHDAFLSYSHAADGRLAPAVQRGLHRLAKPWYRIRALRVFRDQLSLSANPDLWASITTAMSGSRFFILMASPESSASSWVRREVQYWRAHREQATFLIVLTAGQIVWDDSSGDFDWARTTALPPQLRGWFTTEPLWVELSWARSDTELSVRHSRFRDAIATLAAPIRGVPKEDLDSEDVRQYRLTTRLRNAGIAVLTILTVVSLILGLVARGQTTRAQTALRKTISRELSIRSQSIGDTDPAVSQLLSVAAWRLDPTSDARAAMIAAFNRAGVAVFPGGGGPVAISPDHRTLATGAGATVRFWDAVDHRPIGTPLTGHAGFVGSVKFSPAGGVLATGGADGTVRMWDAVSHRQIGDPLIRGSAVVRAVTFSLDGSVLAMGGDDGGVRLWETSSRRQIGDAFAGYDTGSVALSPDGRTVAFYGRDGAVRLWDTVSHKEVGGPLTGFVGAVVAVAFSPDGRMVATGGYDGTVRLWNAASGGQVGAFNGFTGGIARNGVNYVSFSADGDTLTATGVDGTVRSWEVASGTQLGDALTGDTGISTAAFSADGDTLVTSGDDGTVRVWDLSQRNRRGTPLSDAGEDGYSAQFSPDGRILAIGDGNGTVRLWDVATRARLGVPLADAESGAITSMVFSPDGHILAAGGSNSRTRLWDVATQSPIGDALSGGRESVPFNGRGPLAFSSDGSLFVSAESSSVRTWNVSTRTVVADFRPGPSDSPPGFASSATSRDGRILATGTYNGKVLLWDLGSRRRTGDILTGSTEPVASLAIGPDDRTLVTGGSSGAVRLWDIPSRRQLGSFAGFAGDRVLSLAFSPDGVTLAGAAEDGLGYLWDVTSRVRIGLALNHYAEVVQSLEFSPDSRILVTSTGTNSPAVRLWMTPSTARIDSALCARVGRSLTPDEWQRFVPELAYQRVCP